MVLAKANKNKEWNKFTTISNIGKNQEQILEKNQNRTEHSNSLKIRNILELIGLKLCFW